MVLSCVFSSWIEQCICRLNYWILIVRKLEINFELFVDDLIEIDFGET